MLHLLHQADWTLPFLAVGLFGLALALLTWSLSRVRLPSGMAPPAEFRLLRGLLALERGVLAACVLALLAYVGLWLPSGAHTALIALYFAGLLWLSVTTVMRSYAGAKVTPGYVYELIAQPRLLPTIGLSKTEFYGLLLGVALLVAVLSVAAMGLRDASAEAFLSGSSIALCSAFLVLNVTLRAYLTFFVQKGHVSLLALDDSVSLAAGTELLVPGLRVPRPRLVNLGFDSGFERYHQGIRTLTSAFLPRPYSVLWISIESLRFDALGPVTAPRLWAAQDRFQARLGETHWSGANATHFSIFSMLSGLSPLHYGRFVEAKLHLPLLQLLSHNGYRLGFGKSSDLRFRKQAALLPPGVESFDAGDEPPEVADERMTDWYLESLDRKESDPRFDCLPFDATHWTYFFPPGHDLFQPADPPNTIAFFLRKPEELQHLHNRYLNAIHFVDAQIGRILAALEAAGRLEKTIIVLAGDHGEEFQERGQVAHSGALNDQNARTSLWLHLPREVAPHDLKPGRPTLHMDLVPTLLQCFGLESDVLCTQGRSLLEPAEPLPLLILAEQGLREASHVALVTDEYVSRWTEQDRWLWLSSVERRTAGPVEAEAWLGQIGDWYPTSARRFQMLPDPSQPPRAFGEK